jgi:replicative DNA helicase
LFIATEQDKSEIQTLFLSFVAEVDEAHILTGEYLEGEKERVLKAAEILSQSRIYLEFMPDFSLDDIERVVKYHVAENKITCVLFDYIQSTLKILSEIASSARVSGLREDNILFLLSDRLKTIAVTNQIFIFSSTQLSGDIDTSVPDQRLLRGAKSIGDRIDFGSHILNVNTTDIDGILSLSSFFKNGEVPNVKLAIYKNRRASWNNIYLFGYKRLGVCRIDWVFATDWEYNLLSVPHTYLRLEEGAFDV